MKNENYSKLSVGDLKDELDARDMEYPAGSKKADLVALLEEADAQEADLQEKDKEEGAEEPKKGEVKKDEEKAEEGEKEASTDDFSAYIGASYRGNKVAFIRVEIVQERMYRQLDTVDGQRFLLTDSEWEHFVSSNKGEK